MKRSLQLTLPIVIASSLFSAGVLAQDIASKTREKRRRGCYGKMARKCPKIARTR
ncbi:MAG: hypothetical protein IPG34_14210 [Rhodocyclaceae bacterium]|nr:hypothetical protein [Rhodocyclaceae bacterium]